MRYTIILLLFISIKAFPQTRFDRVLNIPVTENGTSLRFPWAGGVNFPLISAIDLNNDSRDDMFIFDHQNNRIITFINNGNSSADLAWDYAPDFATQFPPVNKWALLYDYNCDGKADFFTLSSAIQCSGIALYKNISSGTTLQWLLVDTCIDATYMGSAPQHVFASAISLPHFNDIDGDGDMDILGYNSFPDGRIFYYKNIASTCDSLKFVLETLCWGNFQLLIGGNNSVGCFHCPCRGGHISAGDTAQVDQIEMPQPFAHGEVAKRDDTISSLFAMDVDGDGNKDLLVGDITSTHTLMVHNGGTEMDTQDTLFPSSDIPSDFHGFHYHAYLDVDNDGLNDLIITPYDNENKRGVWLYKNTGTSTAPVFTLQSKNFLQKDMIDVGEDACPVFFDYDNDNLLDLVISKALYDSTTGAYKTGLYLYKNTGTSTAPSFEFITNDFGDLNNTGSYLSPAYPAFGDLDGDGDKDMLVGREDGFLYYYENIALPGDPAEYVTVQPNYKGIDVGKFATPQLFDLDHDGLLDIISGGQRGSIYYYRNTGTANVPAFSNTATNNLLGCIVLQGSGTTDGYTVPFFYDSLGQTRLLVASENGNINQYDHIDGNLSGCFNLAGTIYNPAESSRIKFNITVSGGDLNGDSLTDIVIGQSTGGAEIRFQHNPNIGIAEVKGVKATMEIFPNPVNEQMSVHVYHTVKNSGLELFNSIGEMIRVVKVEGDVVALNTSELTDGMYFLRLTSANYSVSRKVIVRH